MKAMFHGTIAAAAIAAQLGTTIVFAESPALVPVSVNPGTSLDIVLFASANDGKPLTHTNAHGRGAFSASEVAELGKLDVVEEKCSDQTRVLLIPANAYVSNPNDCKRRHVGAFWWGHDDELNVKLSKGMGAGTKTALWIGAGVGAVVLAKVIHDETTDKAVAAVTPKPAAASQTTAPAPPQPSAAPQPSAPQPSAPQPSAPSLTSLFGNFNISATKTIDTGCNFVPSFPGQVQVTGDPDGRMKLQMLERLVRVYNGALRSDGTFTANGSGSLGGYNYTAVISGQISGNSIQGTERLTFSSGCADRQVEYRFTGTR